MKKVIYWTPRILSIFMILFLGLFALDVFEPGKGLIYYLSAFVIHLMPNFLLAIVLFIAWRHEVLGGFLFIIIALSFTIFFNTYQEPLSFLLISMPIIIIGIFFIINGKLLKKS